MSGAFPAPVIWGPSPRGRGKQMLVIVGGFCIGTIPAPGGKAGSAPHGGAVGTTLVVYR